MAIASSPSSPISDEARTHLYSLCYFAPGEIVPSVELFEAADDKDAIVLAHSKRPAMMREIWDRHRLVARISNLDKRTS